MRAWSVSVLSNSVGALPQIQKNVPANFRGHPHALEAKVGNWHVFAFMPAMAFLWSIVLGMEVNTTIRILTVLFIPGLLMALGGAHLPQLQIRTDRLN